MSKKTEERQKTTPCRGCGVGIVFIETTDGKPMPCDPRRIVVVTDDGRVVSGRAPHWASCPAGKTFRKPKEKGGEEVSHDEARRIFDDMRGTIDGREPEEEI